jgi:hypothetical protein
MTVTRAAAWLGVLALLGAWLASAASTSRRAQPSPPAPPPARAETERLAQDVQAQAARLRTRLAAAPAPKQPVRNPFAFRPRADAPQPRAPRLDYPPPPPAPALDDLPLVLIGVAEDATAGGPVRTAMIAAEADQLFLVKAGETVMGRYQVEIVGADAVQLKDLARGGAVRRLALR